MKRLAILVATLVLCFPFGVSAEGIFVPNYDSFMDSLCENISTTHPHLKYLLESFKDENGWKEIANISRTDMYFQADPHTGLEITTHMLHEQLEFFAIRIPCSSDPDPDAIQFFDSLAHAAAEAINPNNDWSNSKVIFMYLKKSLFKDGSDVDHYSWLGMHRYAFIRKDGFVYFIIEVMTDTGESKVERNPFGYTIQ